MPPLMSREIRLRSRPKGRPSADNFTLATVALAPLRDSHVLVRNRYLSVDPCMFCRMRGGKSYLPPFELGRPLEGGAVGTVVESRSDAFKPGDIVISNFGWREWYTAASEAVRHISCESHPLSLYLDALGLQRVCSWASAFLVHVKPGGNLLISGGASVSGSVASQLSNLRGCRIIGSAGSRDRVSFLREECGFDIAFGYKEGPILEQLDDVSSPVEEPREASLEAALGLCMAGSLAAKAAPGALATGPSMPLPIYFLFAPEAPADRAENTHTPARELPQRRRAPVGIFPMAQACAAN